MSSTWSGSTETGNLSYTLRGIFYRRLEDIPPAAGRAVCRLTIDNQSPRDFDPSGLNLDADDLGLWLEGVRLRASDAGYTIRGADQQVASKVDEGTPEGLLEAEMLVEAPRSDRGSRMRNSLTFLNRWKEAKR